MISFSLYGTGMQKQEVKKYLGKFGHGVQNIKWALGSITTNKVRGDRTGIPVELFQILKDDAMKVPHSIRQQIWKTQQWPQD